MERSQTAPQVHILVISQYFFPESFKVNDLVVGLQEQGHRVTVFTGLPNYPSGRFFPGFSWGGPYREDYQGATVYRTPLIPRGKGGGLRLSINYLSFAFLACLSILFRCRERYDAIFVFQTSPVTVGLPAMVMKAVRKIPIVFWVQDSWPESLVATGAVRSPFLLALVARLVRMIYSSCDRILVQSQLFVQHVVKVGSDPSKVSYFPNWAEDFYQPASQEDAATVAGELPDGFVILFAGNLGRAQSLETILEAAEATLDSPKIQWALLGDGREREHLEAEIARRGLQSKVHLLGRREPEQMPAYFAAADVLLVTLRKEFIFELTVPSKVQTYMACEKAILGALDGEGATVIRESGGGKTCPAGDGRALAQLAIEMSQLSSQELQEMGKHGGQWCRRRFSRQELLQELQEIFCQIRRK